ncbi:MAG: L-threonine 3-dehydrogenase [Gaiellales bacterium]
MRAIRKVAPERGLVLDEVAVPEIGEDEVLVQVEAASICGTDLHIHNWDEWAQHRIHPPLTLGHEFAGTVVATGRLVRHVHEGDYVSAESHVTCGMCFQCRTGHAHMCEHTQILGVDRDGAFAEYVAVPESVIWHNDRALLPPEIATLQEPFGNAVFATGEQELTGRSVGILGCGPIGLFSIAIAKAAGAAGVWAADRTAFRLGLAERMGATATVNVDTSDDVAGWFRDNNEGYGLDVVFEMSGSGRAINDAFRIARNGGRVVLFGIPSRPVEIDVAEALIFKNLSVLALNGRKVFDTWYKTRWMLERKVVDLTPLITGRLDGLDGVEGALQQLEAGEACKVVVFPNGRPETPVAAPARRPRPEARKTREPKWAHQ